VRIVSLLPAATDIVAELGCLPDLAGGTVVDGVEILADVFTPARWDGSGSR
jgi:hypothetical protein